MYGNPLALDYNRFSPLATNGTWFKNVWELLHEYKTHATFGKEMQLLPVRVGDKSIMEELFSKYYSGQEV